MLHPLANQAQGMTSPNLYLVGGKAYQYLAPGDRKCFIAYG